MRTVAVSGYFDPPHIGHLRMFKEASRLGDVLIVILNNTKQQQLKGSIPFMPLYERMEFLHHLRSVDIVVQSIDTDATVCKTLEAIRPDVFANGGDRLSENTPEFEVCKQLGIEMVFGVGGGKINSSSKLIYEAAKTLGVVSNTGTASVPLDKNNKSTGRPAYLTSEPLI